MRINYTSSLVSTILIVSISGCGTEELPFDQRASSPDQHAVSFSEQATSGAAEGADGPRYSDWSTPVNLGSAVNSPSEDLNPTISRNGLILYFASPRPDAGMVPTDLWVSVRSSVEMSWGPAQNLGAIVNMPAPVAENGPAISIDGHKLFFNSNRPGGQGNMDLYVSRRRGKRGEFGWETPVNLGSAINSSANDQAPAFFEDEDGKVSLYFSSNRSGGGNDIYVSILDADGNFGTAEIVTELSSVSDDQVPAIRRDGLEIFFASNRLGTLGETDIWVATRASTSDPWSTPLNLGSQVNTIHVDAGPDLSFDGTTLYFHTANREGNIGGPRFDIWSTTREKLTGPEPD